MDWDGVHLHPHVAALTLNGVDGKSDCVGKFSVSMPLRLSLGTRAVALLVPLLLTVGTPVIAETAVL